MGLKFSQLRQYVFGESGADLFLVADDGVGAGGFKVAGVELISGADDDVGGGGELANVFEDGEGTQSCGEGDDDEFGESGADVFEDFDLRGVADVSIEPNGFGGFFGGWVQVEDEDGPGRFHEGVANGLSSGPESNDDDVGANPVIIWFLRLKGRWTAEALAESFHRQGHGGGQSDQVWGEQEGNDGGRDDDHVGLVGDDASGFAGGAEDEGEFTDLPQAKACGQGRSERLPDAPQNDPYDHGFGTHDQGGDGEDHGEVLGDPDGVGDHADGAEEEGEEDDSERGDVGANLDGESGAAEEHAGDEGAERRGEADRVGRPSGAQPDHYGQEDGQLAVFLDGQMP